MANIVYNDYKSNLITGTAAFSNVATTVASDFGVLLVTSAYSPTETDDVATVLAEEISAVDQTDYARQELTGTQVSLTSNGGNNDDVYKVDADDTSFGSSVSLTAAGAVIFKKGATLSDTPASVVTYIDFAGSKQSTNGEFTIVWNADGILNFKQGA